MQNFQLHFALFVDTLSRMLDPAENNQIVKCIYNGGSRICVLNL